jgi:hypothetical protein
MALSSCEKKQEIVAKNEISQEAVKQINALGFSARNAQQVKDGILVEGDILLTKEMLNSKPESSFLRVGEEEQYRTINIVRLPRTINIAVSPGLPSQYVTATDEAINRFNNAGTQLIFRRVTFGADMVISANNLEGNSLARAGFPSNGNPFHEIIVDAWKLRDRDWNVPYLASLLAHEIGHCIGFRHTDYMNRQSCGEWVNEGYGIEGAVLIPGTPAGVDSNSWMLACIPFGNRPFTANDLTALRYLYLTR